MSLMTSLEASESWQAFKESKSALFGAVCTIGCIFAALFAPWVSPQNPYDLMSLFLENSNLAPDVTRIFGFEPFALGSDSQGRCLLSAIFYGLRISLFVGIASTLLSAFVGTLLGLIAGYLGGWVDALIMRLADIQLSFPAILIALVIMSIWGEGLLNIIIAISVVNWVYYARTARGSTLAERENDYVDAARSIGVPTVWIMLGEILPNIMAPIIVIGTVRVANSILLESTLSFLGLGVPVTEPSLGSLISSGYQLLFSGQWWVSVFPGISLMIVVLGMNLLGDCLRDLLNPRLKR